MKCNIMRMLMRVRILRTVAAMASCHHVAASVPTFALALCLALVPARAGEPLIADLDSHLVAIATDFTGGEVMLFGSVEGTGDVVVVVHGPKETMTVRRKEKIAGIWINTQAVTFDGVPAFYHVATTANAIPELPTRVLARHQIGAEHIRMRTRDDAPESDSGKTRRFRESLISAMQQQGHYSAAPGLVERRGERLFRTSVVFPADVPVGTYTVETMLVVNGEILTAQQTPLFVSKVGLGARIYKIAHDKSFIYGVAAVMIAAFAGLGGNYLFRKR